MKTLIVFGVLFICATVHGQFTYDAQTAKSMIEYSGAAYCCGLLGHGVAPGDWSCYACKMQPGMQNITVFDARLTNANGYVGYQPATQQIIVAFSGTDPLSIENDLKDLTFWKTKYTVGGCHKCEVHKGFYESWNSVKSAVMNAVELLLLKQPGATVWVTGHSLGAALAELCAMDLIYAGWPSLPLAPVYTFGTPRLGNDNFADFFNSSLLAAGSHSFKVVHWKDPVPHVPPKHLSYRFAPQQIFYNSPQNNYTVCSPVNGEDPKCSDQFIFNLLHIADHLNYLGFDITKNYMTCKI